MKSNAKQYNLLTTLVNTFYSPLAVVKLQNSWLQVEMRPLDLLGLDSLPSMCQHVVVWTTWTPALMQTSGLSYASSQKEMLQQK